MTDPYLAIRRATDVLSRLWAMEVGIPDTVRPKAAEIASALSVCQQALVDQMTGGTP